MSRILPRLLRPLEEAGDAGRSLPRLGHGAGRYALSDRIRQLGCFACAHRLEIRGGRATASARVAQEERVPGVLLGGAESLSSSGFRLARSPFRPHSPVAIGLDCLVPHYPREQISVGRELTEVPKNSSLPATRATGHEWSSRTAAVGGAGMKTASALSDASRLRAVRPWGDCLIFVMASGG